LSAARAGCAPSDRTTSPERPLQSLLLETTNPDRQTRGKTGAPPISHLRRVWRVIREEKPVPRGWLERPRRTLMLPERTIRGRGTILARHEVRSFVTDGQPIVTR